MKKAVPIFIVLFLCCLAAGMLCSVSFLFGRSAPVRNTMRAASGTAALSSRGDLEPRLNEAGLSVEPMDTADDDLLLKRAGAVLDALADENYVALASMVHPVNGVTFTPYSTVDPESDLCFLPDEIASAAQREAVFLWGFTDGKGDHIRMTMPEYIRRYVWNADYREAPEMAVDQVIAQGNALENVADVFVDCRFVEYHFSSLDPKQEGFDWCSLKLVFAPYEEQWFLVGLIHSEWTI